jgi:putative ABC transport system ATP-binding protein
MPSELSGGQQQRVAIARAIVTDPVMILADEPTGNLDSASTHEIMKLLIELNNQGRTVVLITHEDEVASYAKRVVTLRDGKITRDAAPERRTLV